MSKRQFDDIQDGIRDLRGKIENLERQFKKRNLSFSECIPPHHICRDILVASNSNLLGNYEHIMQVLSDYYGVTKMDNRHKPEKVPEKAVACYSRWDNTAYYKAPGASMETVLHEFFHHLHGQGIVTLSSDENAEKCADAYAKIVTSLGSIP